MICRLQEEEEEEEGEEGRDKNLSVVLLLPPPPPLPPSPASPSSSSSDQDGSRKSNNSGIPHAKEEESAAGGGGGHFRRDGRGEVVSSVSVVVVGVEEEEEEGGGGDQSGGEGPTADQDDDGDKKEEDEDEGGADAAADQAAEQQSSKEGKKAKKKKKKKRKKKKKKMFDEEVDRYDSYEEYLDSLVSEEDHFYLEDEEMARIIAELGYRSSGDTLSRENFYKMKARLAEKRLLTMKTTHSNSDDSVFEEDDGGGGNGKKSSLLHPLSSTPRGSASTSPGRTSSSASPMSALTANEPEETRMVRELRGRAKEINSGELHTLIFMQTSVPRRSKRRGGGGGVGETGGQGSSSRRLEVSGHIDLAHRQRTENFLPYLTGEKRLIPKSGDLTFYNWARGKADLQSTPNFEVSVKGSKLLLRHRASGVEIDATGIGGGSDGVDAEDGDGEEDTTPRPFLRKTGSGFSLSGWRKLRPDSAEEGGGGVIEEDPFGTVTFVYDIKFPPSTPTPLP